MDLGNGRIIRMFNLYDDFINDIELYQDKQKCLVNITPELSITNKNGKPIEPGNYSKLFKRMLEKSGISNANFDVLRNTFAVTISKQGLDPADLHGLLGYVDSLTALRKFKRLCDIQRNRAVD